MRSAIAIAALALSCAPVPEPPAEPDPGTVPLRRLNRTELDRSLRQLFAVDHDIVMHLPDDDVGNGFDNQAGVLSLSPLHLELLDAALYEMLTYDVFPAPLPVVTQRVEAEAGSGTSGQANGVGWNLWSNGTWSGEVTTAHAGTYSFVFYGYGTQGGDEPVRALINHDGEDEVEVSIDWSSSQPIELEWDLPVGFHTINIRFINDYYDPDAGEDRNLIIDWVELAGPHDALGPTPPGYDEVFTCQPSAATEPACAQTIARDMGLRAWRRPLTDEEVAALVALYERARDEGEEPDRAVGWMLRGMLLSPNFLFKVELDADPEDPTSHPVSEYELATRLSYFLWQSPPDALLLARAEQGRLSDPEELEEQVFRMLADPRADALVDGLGTQWLSVSAVDGAFPDPAAFPEFSESLRASLREEMRRQIEDLFLSDRDLRELLTGTETFIDRNLAIHYGLPEPEPSPLNLDPDGTWEAVDLTDTERRGLLSTAGWLTATSYPTRTSPVLRGKWVLDNLLCESPAPPPPGVEALGEREVGRDDDIVALHAHLRNTSEPSVRERLERHRVDPTCQSCHQSIDPVGFAFEHYDAIGAWRNTDSGQAIDASGVLPDGFAFEGNQALTDYLAQSRKFDRCVVQKTFTWALGRAPGVQDLRYLEQIEAEYTASDRRFAALLAAIVRSEPFRYRRAVAATPATLESADE